MGRPKGSGPHKPGQSQPWSKKPARSTISVVRDLFDHVDASGMTLDDLARRTGIHPVTMSYWKHGRNAPNMQGLEAVAQVLGLRIVLLPVSNVSRDDGQTQQPDAQ